MELRQLRLFVTLAEGGHFGRAAERSYITQPALTQQIQALERSIGAKLVERDARRVELTHVGRALLPPARVLLEMADRTAESVKLASEKDLILKLGTTAARVHPALERLVSEFRRRYPRVDLEVFPNFGPATVDALVKRSLDPLRSNCPSNRSNSPCAFRSGSSTCGWPSPWTTSGGSCSGGRITPTSWNFPTQWRRPAWSSSGAVRE